MMSERRPSLRHGLPLGWWRNPDLWVSVLIGIPMLAMLLFILGAWFL